MAANQGAVADTALSWVGRTLQWQTWSPPASGTLVQDVFGDTVPAAPSNNALACCCWEFPILAALHTANALTTAQAQTIYGNLAAQRSTKADGLINLASKKSWKGLIKGHKPVKGDLIFFEMANNELAHVVIATGEEINGETGCISHWSADSATGPVVARVSQTTVENLKRVGVAAGLGNAACFFASPVW